MSSSFRRTKVCTLGLSLLAMAWVVGSVTPASAAEYRAFWVDAWGAGFLNQGQVDTLLGVPGTTSAGQIRDANCNAVIVQVRRRADVCYPSGMQEPYFSSGLSPSDFNALQAIINAAHDTTGGKKRIEVHCWIVTFKTAKGTVYSRHIGTPTGSLTNFDNYWPTRIGSTTGPENGDGAFDPGHPKCLEYLVGVCMDLVDNFDIDGIHYDYIRFEGNSEGYNPTSVARYKARYGLTSEPASTDEQFKQWRRDQVTSLVRQVYARIQKSKPHVRQSGSFVTWNPSPGSSTRNAFKNTRPYYDVYSDWDSWLEEGICDMAVPMTYYDYSALPTDYVRWMNFEKDRHGNRHMIIGPGIYQNSLSNAITELLMTRDPSPAGNYADGFSGYSYRVPYAGGSWSGFAPTFKSQVTPTWVDVPEMPWKTAPTKGHIMGIATLVGSGAWADHTLVSLTGPETRSMYVDGTGFYAFIDLSPGTYAITADKFGWGSAQANVTVAVGEVTGNMYEQDFVIERNAPPVITNVEATGILAGSATITWTTDLESSSQVEYGTTTAYGNLTPLDDTRVLSHSVVLTGLAANTLYHYRVISTHTNGTTTSNDYTFTSSGVPLMTNVQATNVTASGATITWATNAPTTSQVRYGLTSSYGSQTALDPTEITAHSVTLSGLLPSTLYHYQAVSTNVYGTAESADGTFTTAGEIIIDNTDTTCTKTGSWLTGSYAGVPKIGANYLYIHMVPTASAATCTWRPNLSVAGHYDVWVFYQCGTNRCQAAQFTVAYNGGQLMSIQNQYGSSGLSGWYQIGTDLPFAAGTAGYVRCTNTSTDTDPTRYVSADAAKFVYKHRIPPTITQHPAAQVACPGSEATFTVAATGGTGLTYQWQKNGSNLSEGGHYSGVSTTTLHVSVTDAGDAGNYACVVTNIDASTPSNTASLTVRAATAITGQPVAQDVCPGVTAMFSVTATGDGVTYQWQKDGTDLAAGGHYSGVTATTLTITDVDAGDTGEYRCLVSAGCGNVVSDVVTLRVKTAASIVTQPVGQNVCAGGTAAFGVTAPDDGTLTYQWQKDGTDITDGGHYTGAGTNLLTVSPADAGDLGSYRCVVTGGCGSVLSDGAPLSLAANTAITQQPLSQSVDVGGTAVFTVTASGDGSLSYQWQKGGTDVSDDDRYSGTTTDALTISAVVGGDAGDYRCTVTAGCGSATSSSATLAVNGSNYVDADLDNDDDVDLMDFNSFQNCFNGPNNPPKQSGCDIADFDGDADVDLIDFGKFQACFNGPNRPSNCH